MKRMICHRLATLLAIGLACSPSPVSAAELLGVQRIWDAAPHNAFTDLVHHRGQWFCVFREGQGHVSPDGAVRVLCSADGTNWQSAARLASPTADLRDPKITVTSQGRLYLSAAGALHQPAAGKHQSLVWFSDDGRQWGEPVPVAEVNQWLWRIVWHKEAAYGVGYDTLGERFIRWYASPDGRQFKSPVPNLFSEGYPNETGLAFLPDDTVLCLLRRDGEKASGQLGIAAPPYTQWQWRDLGVKIGGLQLIRLPDARLVAAVRLYDGQVRTALAWLDWQKPALTEFLKLPSGGDASYPGLVWHAGLLWVSYFSSHEGKTAIYLAQVRL